MPSKKCAVCGAEFFKSAKEGWWSKRTACSRRCAALMPRPSHRTAEQKLEKMVRRGKPDECWPWTGGVLNKLGYGIISRGKGESRLAHRAAWEMANGRKATLHIMHSCDNPSCCNPAHLSEGSHQENMADMARKGRAWKGGSTKGEAHWSAKLTAADVLDLRQNDERTVDAAKRLGVSKNLIWMIRSRRIWKHVA